MIDKHFHRLKMGVSDLVIRGSFRGFLLTSCLRSQSTLFNQNFLD